MGKSPLESVVTKWNERGATFAAQGVPTPIIKAIGLQDIQKVMRGGSGLTDTEARLAIASGSGKGTIIPPKQRGTKPTDLPGNLVKDIGDMAKGVVKLPQAVAGIPSDFTKSIRSFTDPEYAAEQGQEPSNGDFAKGLRNVASLPIMKWIPGVHTAAGLTTSEGRKELLRHPAGTILDVGAAVFPVAKGAGQANLARRGLLTETATGKGFTIAESAKGTLPAAAAKGHIIGYAARKSPIVGDYIRKLDDKIALSRGFSIAGEKVKRQLQPIVTELNDLVAAKTPEEQVKFFEDVTNGRIPEDLELQVAYDKVADYSNWLENAYIGEGELGLLTLNGKEYTYPTKGRGGKLLTTKSKLDFHQDKLGGNLTRLENKTARLEDNIATWQSQIDKLQAKVDEIASKNPTPKRRRTANKHGVAIITLKKKIADAPNRVGYKQAVTAYERRKSTVDKLQAEFDKRSVETAPPTHHPMLQQEMQARAMARIDEMRELKLAPEIIQRAMNSYTLGKYSTLYTKAEWAAEVKDLESGWQMLAAESLDPLFVHVVPESQIGKGGVNPLDYHFTPGQIKERRWENMTPTRQNVMVAMSHAAQEYLRYKGNEQAFIDHIVPHGLTEDMVDLELEPFILKEVKSRGISPALARSKLFDEKYVKVSDSANFAFRKSRIRAMMNGRELFVPVHIAKTWSDLATPKTPTGLRKVSERATAVFKTTLFSLSLRHAADEMLGGMVMLMGRGDWRDIASVGEAISMVRKNELPVEIPQGIDLDSPDKLLQLAMGGKAARTLEKIHGKVNALQRFTIFVTNIEKAMGYLGETKRSTSKGFDVATSHELGLKHVEKTFVDWHSMLPIERQVIRQVFPFYAFCVDRETEALTQRGWVSGYELREDDTILSMDPNTKELKWSSIKSIYRNESYEGEMHVLKGPAIDALVTPGHKFVTQKGKLKKVEELNTQDKIQLMGEGVDSPSCFSDSFVELVGWAVTEGHYKKNRSGNITTIEISQKNTSPYIEDIRKCLRFSNARWHEFLAGVDKAIRYFGVTGGLAALVIDMAPNRVMTDEFINSLSLSQRELLLQTMLNADGHLAGNGTQRVFTQKSKEAMDAFTKVATLSGYQTQTWQGPDGCYRTTLRTRKILQVVNLKKRYTTNHYRGLVWCPETEYGTFVCRRNGLTYVTGNTRYALRYALTYPIDHPYRASILYHLSAAERDDWDNGLPQQWQQLFFLGDADKNGNILASDVKVLNPFRDIDSMMSLRGFYSQLGPLPKIALSPLGVNTILGVPDLYPELTYDEETGKLVSKRAGVQEMVTGGIASLIPPAQAIEHFLQTTQSMRVLKVTNPQAYRRQLYSALGIPLIPTEYNVPQTRAKGEISRYKSAQMQVSDALRSGDSSSLEGLSTVPFMGQFVNADLLRNFLSRIDTNGISPRSLLPSIPTAKTPPPLPKPTNQGA